MVIRIDPAGSGDDVGGASGDGGARDVEKPGGERRSATRRRAPSGRERRRPLSAVVLAAGEGTRMRSTRPKPLHRLCGRPMVLHVLDALAGLAVTRVVVVVGHRADWVTKTLIEHAPPGMAIEFVEQPEQRGTGDAMSVALTGLPTSDDDDADVVVLPGDTPLLRATTLADLVREHRSSDAAATLLTAVLADPSGYGRVVRGRDDAVARVVEHGDATDEERSVDEINTSIYCFRRSVLAPSLRRLSPANAQGEYYLTDVFEVLYEAGHRVTTLVVEDTMEVAGVNDRAQLAVAEAELRDRINERWMRTGVTMWDPQTTYIDVDVELDGDVVLLPGVMLQGRCRIGEHAEIGPNTRLVDTTVGEGAVVTASVCQRSHIGADARVGPFCVLPEGTDVPPGTVVAPPETPPESGSGAL
jgi:bifunctional UDP-N-acetylglucosamine pyrophosphorylase / glucosamine-1-phosphate N-acetyltransferase